MIRKENQMTFQIEMIDEEQIKIHVLLAAAVLLYVLQRMTAGKEKS